MAFKNFSIWRGKLPHWRADDVTYYVTFRHRRPLEDSERRLLLRELVKPNGVKWHLLILGVFPDQSELVFKVGVTSAGETYELAQIVEKAKARAGKHVIKKTGERFPPFYEESYDRIIRDEVELEERWQAIFDLPTQLELAEDPEDYEFLWVADSPSAAN